ncbi:MAG: hypothetical protein GX326_04510 [Clostridiaceae bacterium]|nr:hypothetical protein [Clostridiaceae bacterium]
MSSNKATEVERYRNIQKRKTTQRRLLIAIITLAIIVITMFLIIRILNHYKPSPQFMFLEEKELADQYQVKALIIRDETVFQSPETGTVRSLFADGAKVAKNENLAYIIKEEQDEKLIELQNIENEIIHYQYEIMDKDGNLGAKQIDSDTENQLREVYRNIYTEILNNNLANISTDESTLNTILNKRNEQLRNYDFNDSRLDELLDYHQKLEKELGSQSNVVTSSQSGIYIRSLDGLEERLNPANLANLTPEDLRHYLDTAVQGRLEPVEKVTKDEPFYCLTNSIEQYFAFFIPAGLSTEIQVSSVVDAKSKEGIPLDNGVVIRSEETELGTMIVMRCDTSLERLSDRRIVDLSVELNKVNGLRVPLSSLINFEKGNTEAEILVEEGGYIAKTKVKVKNHNNDYAIIESSEDAEIPVNVATMIVLNPKDVSVGDSAAGNLD